MFDNKDQQDGARSKLAWVILGIIAAIALAIFGGVMLGELASPFADRKEADSTASVPLPTVIETTPSDIETPIEILPPILPEIAISTSLARDSAAQPIDPQSWVRQDDFPRQLFRGENVRGMIAAYLTITPDGSVRTCEVGSSSEVEPAHMLRPAAVGVCRALQARARFQPFAAPDPHAAIAPVLVTPSPRPSATVPNAQQDVAPQGVTAAPTPEANADRQLSVRVAFRTGQQHAQPDATDIE